MYGAHVLAIYVGMIFILFVINDTQYRMMGQLVNNGLEITWKEMLWSKLIFWVEGLSVIMKATE
jgi:hypothetical protein